MESPIFTIGLTNNRVNITKAIGRFHNSRQYSFAMEFVIWSPTSKTTMRFFALRIIMLTSVLMPVPYSNVGKVCDWMKSIG